MFISFHVQKLKTVILFLCSDKHLVYLQDRVHLTQERVNKRLWTVCSLFIYHSDLSLCFPISKRHFPTASSPYFQGFSIIFPTPHLIQISPLLYPCPTSTSMPIPHPISNQVLLLTFRFKINTILIVIGVPKVRYACPLPILPSLHKNDLINLWLLQPKVKTLILLSFLLRFWPSTLTTRLITNRRLYNRGLTLMPTGTMQLAYSSKAD